MDIPYIFLIDFLLICPKSFPRRSRHVAPQGKAVREKQSPTYSRLASWPSWAIKRSGGGWLAISCTVVGGMVHQHLPRFENKRWQNRYIRGIQKEPTHFVTRPEV